MLLNIGIIYGSLMLIPFSFLLTLCWDFLGFFEDQLFPEKYPEKQAKNLSHSKEYTKLCYFPQNVLTNTILLPGECLFHLGSSICLCFKTP